MIAYRDRTEEIEICLSVCKHYMERVEVAEASDVHGKKICISLLQYPIMRCNEWLQDTASTPLQKYVDARRIEDHAESAIRRAAVWLTKIART